jgi:cytochrome c-type biogenesis protein CcmH
MRLETRRLAFALAALCLLAASPAPAVQPDEVLPDARMEARARALSAELRCMVCQNQSIDDSDAGLAKDLRVLVRQRLLAGDSDAEVLDYLVARYGQFVLLRPRLETQTLVLWGMPVVLLLFGGTALFVLRRRAAPAPATPLSASEEAAVARVLNRLDRDPGGA